MAQVLIPEERSSSGLLILIPELDYLNSVIDNIGQYACITGNVPHGHETGSRDKDNTEC